VKIGKKEMVLLAAHILMIKNIERILLEGELYVNRVDRGSKIDPRKACDP